MKQAKRKPKLPTIATLVLTALIMVLGNAHMCLLSSTIVEIAMLLFIVVGFSFWTYKAKKVGRAWLRTVISSVIAIALQHAYLTWLHSEYFPKALLSRKTIEWQSQIKNETEQLQKAQQPETNEFNTKHPTSPLTRTRRGGPP